MSKGKAQVNYLHSEGLVGASDMPDWSFIYDVSKIKHPSYEIGDRVCLPDGRVFRYAKSSGECYTGRGNSFQDAVPTVGIDYVVLTASAAIGDTLVKTTATVTHTEDDLRGGHALLKPTGSSADSVLQMRLITGNTAASAAGEITIYLDAGLTAALTTSSYIVAMPNPWGNIKYDGNTETSVAGLAATYVSATGYYFWIQTWGLCWIAPQADGPGITSKARQLVFRHDGSVGIHDYSDAYETTAQHAGFVIDNNTALNGATKMMLQICP